MKLEVLSWLAVQALARELVSSNMEVVHWHGAVEATLTEGLGPVCEAVPAEKVPAAIELSLAEDTAGPAGYTDMYRVLFWNITHLLAAVIGILSSGSRSEAIESSATRVPYLHLVSWAVAQGRVREAVGRGMEGDDPDEVLAELYAETQRDFTEQLIGDIETSHWPMLNPANRMVNFQQGRMWS